MNKRTLAILAAIGATTIYGLNHTIAKGIMPNYMGPLAVVVLRVVGASILFWLLSFFGPKEKIDFIIKQRLEVYDIRKDILYR